MTRKQIIEALKAKGVDFNPTLKLADLEAEYKKHFSATEGAVDAGILPPTEKPQSDTEKLLAMMSSVINKVDSMETRLSKVEGPNGNEFKNDAKVADIEKAAKQKESLDPRLVKIVEETLGIDFGVELETFPDRPGFLFTVIVPTRLSDMPPSTRPVIDPDTGKYKVQTDGKTPILEDYIPEDRRSRAIGSAQSYDAVRDHCNKVRSYLVAYYTKLSKPLPEFKIKQ